MTLQERANKSRTCTSLRRPVGRAIGNPDHVQKFLEPIAAGNYLDAAAQLAGLSKATVDVGVEQLAGGGRQDHQLS